MPRRPDIISYDITISGKRLRFKAQRDSSYVIHAISQKLGLLGSGINSHVFSLSEDKALRVFRKYTDGAAFKWLSWCAKNQHLRFVPRIFDMKVLECSDGKLVLVSMEKLQEIDWEDAADITDWYSDLEFVTCRLFDTGPGRPSKELTSTRSADFIAIARGIAHITRRGYCLDMHEGNLMMRADRTPVVTDPLC